MTSWQKTIKYLAIAFAIFLTVSIFAGIFGALGTFSLIDNVIEGSNSSEEEMKIYSVDGEIHDIKIEIGAADFAVIVGEKFYVESNISTLSVKEQGGCFVIKDDSAFKFPFSPVSGGTVNVYVPADFVFSDAYIDAGAGNAVINGLSANELEMNLGAGEVIIENLHILGNTDISGGAGAVSVTDCVLNNADISMGVGEFNLAGELKGRNEISLGVGEANITLIGAKSDYELSVTKGLGEAKVDGNRIEDSQTVGNGKNKVDVSGGVGEVNIEFAS